MMDSDTNVEDEWFNVDPVYVTKSDGSSAAHGRWIVGQEPKHKALYNAAAARRDPDAFLWGEALGSSDPVLLDRAVDVLWELATRPPRPGCAAFGDVDRTFAVIAAQAIRIRAALGSTDHKFYLDTSKSVTATSPLFSRLTAAHLPEIFDSVLGARCRTENAMMILLSACEHNIFYEAFAHAHPDKMKSLATILAQLVADLPPVPNVYRSTFRFPLVPCLLSAIVFAWHGFVPPHCLEDSLSIALDRRLITLPTEPMMGPARALTDTVRSLLRVSVPTEGFVFAFVEPDLLDGRDLWSDFGSVCDFGTCGIAPWTGEHSVNKMLRCSRCKCTVYCGAEHQRAAWTMHKLVCVSTGLEASPQASGR